MTERIPKSGELYRHFKNKLYQIITVAEHSETGEQMVIYQALYGEFKVYARPLQMFVSEVDREKYPDAPQKYRFEKVESTELRESPKDAGQEENAEQPEKSEKQTASAGSEDGRQAEGVNPKLMAFLDTDDFEEKYRILLSMGDEMTDRLINDMAVVLDVVIPEGKLDERYEALKACVRTRQKYETMRLR